MRPLHDVHQVGRRLLAHSRRTQVLIRDGRRLRTRPVTLSVDEQHVVINDREERKQYTLRLDEIVACRVHANGTVARL
jgi:hypothetical protein